MKPKTVSEYIKLAPKEAQGKLKELRGILKNSAPKATEAMKWGSPVFEDKRILFAYGAFKTHINFMPTPAVLKHFKKDLTDYVVGKGSVKLPYNKPLPKTLISKMARYRVKELKEKDAKWM